MPRLGMPAGVTVLGGRARAAGAGGTQRMSGARDIWTHTCAPARPRCYSAVRYCTGSPGLTH